MLPTPSMPVVTEMSSRGRRVVIRYRRRDDRPGPALSDAVGAISARDDRSVTVQTRSGPVRIPLDDIVVERVVAADRRRVLDLERIAALGWRAEEGEDLHGWTLRANHGWTRRANSALPLVTAHRPIDELLDSVGRFYAERGLPARISVPLPARGLLDAELARRCWTVEAPTLVLTGALTDPAAATSGTADLPPVRLTPTATAQWQAGYHARDGQLPVAALDLLHRHPRVSFATVTDDRTTIGIARGVLDEGWLGVSAVEVAPDWRRRGVAGALMAALQSWAAGAGARQCYLQVELANSGARAMYDRLGFFEHHRTHYRLPPG